MSLVGWLLAAAVCGLTPAAAADGPQEPGGPREGQAEDAPPGRWVWLPSDEIFRQPLADTHEPRSYASLIRMHTDQGTFDLGSVGFGDSFPMARFERSDGLAAQFGISAAAFSLFNLDGDDNDLVNTDFVVGVPVSVQSGRWSARARVFHRSSHVEVPFLFRFRPKKLSFEAVELLGAVETGAWRFYAGPTVILSSTTARDRRSFQVGAEVRRPIRQHARWFGALDLNVKEETGWHGDLDLRLGIECHQETWDRAIGVYLEWFHGHVPYGAYDAFRATWVGVGMLLRF